MKNIYNNTNLYIYIYIIMSDTILKNINTSIKSNTNNDLENLFDIYKEYVINNVERIERVIFIVLKSVKLEANINHDYLSKYREHYISIIIHKLKNKNYTEYDIRIFKEIDTIKKTDNKVLKIFEIIKITYLCLIREYINIDNYSDELVEQMNDIFNINKIKILKIINTKNNNKKVLGVVPEETPHELPDNPEAEPSEEDIPPEGFGVEPKLLNE